VGSPQLHQKEDRLRKELVNARNTADALIHTTEKTMAEMGEKVDADVRMEVEQAINNLKQVVKNEDISILRQRTETLNQVAHKLGKEVHQQPGSGGEQANDPSSAPAQNPRQFHVVFP